MIIDAHTHIGDFVKIRMPEDVFLASLDKYNIDFALCFCGSAVEVDHDQNPIPDEDQVTQHDNGHVHKVVRDQYRSKQPLTVRQQIADFRVGRMLVLGNRIQVGRRQRKESYLGSRSKSGYK